MKNKNKLDINDYIKHTGTNAEREQREENVIYLPYTNYTNIETLDISIHQPPFLHWSIDGGVTYDEEHYKKLTGKLEEITHGLLWGMEKECLELFRVAKCTPVKWLGETAEEYIALCGDNIYEHYKEQVMTVLRKYGYKVCRFDDLTEEQQMQIRNDTSIQSEIEVVQKRYNRRMKRLGEIKRKYHYPKLYNSLFFAYCKLYGEAKKHKWIKRWWTIKGKTDRCLTLLKSCDSITVTISKEEGVEGTPIKEIIVRSYNGSVKTPKICYPELMGNIPQWLVEREATIKVEKGKDFEDVKNWILATLPLYTQDGKKGYCIRFANAFHGLYKYIMCSGFIDKLHFYKDSVFYGVSQTLRTKGGEEESVLSPKEKTIELIRALFDLDEDASKAMKNYIDRPQKS